MRRGVASIIFPKRYVQHPIANGQHCRHGCEGDFDTKIPWETGPAMSIHRNADALIPQHGVSGVFLFCLLGMVAAVVV